MSQYQLYHLCHPETNEIKYIGITKNGLAKRLRNHLKYPTNIFIGLWFKELKIEGKLPIIKCVKECDNYEDLLNCEIQEIKKFRELNYDILNITDGGDINPMLGRTHTPEAKEKISKINKGRVVSTEEKIKRREILNKLWGNPKWSDGIRLKMSENSKGEKNPNWRGGISNQKCECGKKKSGGKTCMLCRNISGDKNPFYGKTHTIETIQKIQESIKNSGGFKGKDNPNFKYDINKNELYNLYILENKTVKEISLIYNCAINTINKKLRLYEIYKPKSNIYNLDKFLISSYLKDGLNLSQIGEKFGCNNKIIHKYVKKNSLHEK